MGRASKTSFQRIVQYSWSPFDGKCWTKHKWQPILYCTKSTSSIFEKELVRGGWPEKIAEIYTTEGGTPHLDQRHTVFGQLMDEASLLCWMRSRLLRQG